MSAIAGVIYPDLLQVNDLAQKMQDIMKRSSIEPIASYTYKNFQIGCNDKELACNDKKTIFLALDGRIDNWAELAFSMKIEASNAEEVLLSAYELYGTTFLDQIDGEFAFAILDQLKGVFLLARDRIGKKPLYWYHDKHFFLFASELKALLATGMVPQTAASDSLASYLFFGFIPQDMTPIKEVNKLLPGHYLKISQSQGKSILPYWSYSSYFEKPITTHKSLISVKINELLENAIELRLPEKKQAVGCLVSGGLGSATVASYLTSLASDYPLKAFNVVFQGENDQDLEATKSVAKDLSLDIECSKINPKSFFDELISIAWHLDEPLSDPNSIATWRLAKLAARYTSTVFSGMGSDEMLAGHSRYTSAERNLGTRNRLMQLPKPLINYFLIPLCKLFYKPAAYNILKTSRTNPWQFEYLRNNALFNETELAEAAPKLAKLFDPDTFLHKFSHLSRIKSNVSSFLYFDVKTRLPNCFILQYERLTRAHHLNWETPFLDRHLVEYAAQLAEPEILEESETASYLKPLVQNVFKDAFLKRPKKTRKNFLSSWMLHPEIYDTMKLLIKGTLVETGFISESWLKAQLSDPITASQSFKQLFGVLMLEIWFRLFINRPILNYPPQTSVREFLLN